MRLVTWNVHRGRDQCGGDSLENVGGILAHENADVIALQEVPSEAWVTGLAKRLGLMSRSNMPAGVAILYRSCMLMHSSVSFLYTPACRATPRGGVLVSFSNPDMTMICTHLSAHASMVAQHSEARELAKRVEGIQGDVFVMGDMNAHSASPVLKTLYGTGLRDLWLGARERPHGYLNGCTFPAKRAFQRIDYVMCRSSDVVSVKAVVVSDPVSDHRRLVIDTTPNQ